MDFNERGTYGGVGVAKDTERMEGPEAGSSGKPLPSPEVARLVVCPGLSLFPRRGAFSAK